jgi:isopenicillin-N N-acyltransferase like protein
VLIRRFTSSVGDPATRGLEFGSAHAREVARTVDGYRALFGISDAELTALGDEALDRIAAWSPELGAEVRGIAAGAALPVAHVAAINARTEILAALGRVPVGECSTVVALRDADHEPIAAQNWDWYTGMDGNWLEWTIPHPDGRRVTTFTEYGLVGKIGVNDRGVGTLFNMLHHDDDGASVGVPVHVVARRILDDAHDISEARGICASARVSASTAVTVVCRRSAGKAAATMELWPNGPGEVPPDVDGLLLHTNHFLSEPARFGDDGLFEESTTLERLEALRERLHGRGGDLTEGDALTALSSHTAGVCCHPKPTLTDEPPHATLATIQIDLAGATLDISAGRPCEARRAAR